ncbi:Alpha/Beta hydrolase protein [Microdochium trichocladiopsis]|uniref:Alpha/Beta hydrolase protein n=1 Tax=Microdochium trichocladiopsis TaxID=1682393 RepID=A0A9P8XV39_9PEZI|nr:Alpha/Beta hydrolase protein [Microdochium trichocladiopsis]KAH7014308.1 Alpha/Beta hydrolase protein [Microdochium trichocladiopsis]
MALLSHYPFKAIFTLYSICYALCTLPLWLTASIIPWTRPKREWTILQAIRMQITSKVLHYWSVIELNTSTPLKPGREGRRFTVAQPAPQEMYSGPLDDAEIRPAPVGLTWTKTPVTSGKTLPRDATFILHFHGGAFVIGDGRDHDTGFLAATLIKQFGIASGAAAPAHTCVVTPQYRLSCRPGAHFPAALQDAVTSYIHLVHDLGIPARQVVVSGDSAGGNLALGLLRYITEHGAQSNQKQNDILSGEEDEDGPDTTGLPLPGAVLLWSPWTDISAAQDPNAIYQSPQYSTDYLSGAFGAWGARAYTAFGRLDALDPYISPLHAPFRSPVPVLIHAGGGEVLLQDCEELTRRLRKAGGLGAEGSQEDDGGKGGGEWEKVLAGNVELIMSPHCPHDILLVGAMTGFNKEAKVAARKAGDFWNRVRKIE